MFTDKIAIITGAARGIGLEIAQALYENGANIVICDIDEKKLNEARKKFDANRILTIQCDVSNEEEVNCLVQQTIEQFKRIDILVNNAGITRDNLLLRMKTADWDLVMNINLRGAFLMTQSISKIMLRQRYGRIINIASVIGVIGNAGQSNYAASKAGLIGLTKSTAKELATRGITVNAIAPGYIQTEMTKKLPDSTREQLSRAIPSGRLGNPKDIAKAVQFFASDDAEYITGQTLCVDGGMVM